MMDWRMAGIVALFAAAAIYAYYAYEEVRFRAYEEAQLRKPLTAAEIDGLAAINVGQRECGGSMS